MSNIDCLYVTGAAGNMRHSWNKVKVDGVWYNVDVTLDDPGRGSPKYTYFLISDSQLAKDHKWDVDWDYMYPYLPASPVNYSR